MNRGAAEPTEPSELPAAALSNPAAVLSNTGGVGSGTLLVALVKYFYPDDTELVTIAGLVAPLLSVSSRALLMWGLTHITNFVDDRRFLRYLRSEQKREEEFLNTHPRHDLPEAEESRVYLQDLRRKERDFHQKRMRSANRFRAPPP